jgi:hypothetical protein
LLTGFSELISLSFPFLVALPAWVHSAEWLIPYIPTTSVAKPDVSGHLAPAFAQS